jgi:hypothetical protein
VIYVSQTHLTVFQPFYRTNRKWKSALLLRDSRLPTRCEICALFGLLGNLVSGFNLILKDIDIHIFIKYS